MSKKAIKYHPHFEDAILCDLYLVQQHGKDHDIAGWLNSGTTDDRLAYVKERRAALANGTATSIINKAAVDKFDNDCRELNQVPSIETFSLNNINPEARGHYLVRITGDCWGVVEYLIENLMKAANEEHDNNVRVHVLDRWITGGPENTEKPFWMCVNDTLPLEIWGGAK